MEVVAWERAVTHTVDSEVMRCAMELYNVAHLISFVHQGDSEPPLHIGSSLHLSHYLFLSLYLS